MSLITYERTIIANSKLLLPEIIIQNKSCTIKVYRAKTNPDVFDIM